MKKPAGAGSITLWVIGGLLAAYIIGGVIFYFDLRDGSFFVEHLPALFQDFVITICVPVHLLLSMIWPQYFPYYSSFFN